jgi:uncharacterized protein (DUF1778 family)
MEETYQAKRHTDQVNVKLTPEELKALSTAVSEEETSLSAFTRRAIKHELAGRGGQK